MDYQDLNVRPYTMKLLVENIRRTLSDINRSNIFFILQKVNAPANILSHQIFLPFSILSWALRKPTSIDCFTQVPLLSGFSWGLANGEGSRRLEGWERERSKFFSCLHHFCSGGWQWLPCSVESHSICQADIATAIGLLGSSELLPPLDLQTYW